MLHWMTKPESQPDNENETPQMHDLNFDKESPTVVVIRRDSGSHITAVDSAISNIKPES